MSMEQVVDETLSDQALEDVVASSQAFRRHGHSIERIERRLFKQRRDWRGSRRFELIDVHAGTSVPMRLFLKTYGETTGEADQAAPLREAQVYHHVLSQAKLGTPLLYGSSSEGEGPRALLFEYVDGKRLKTIAHEAPWRAAARWLGRFHHHFSQQIRMLETLPLLVRYDADFYWMWATRALEATAALSAPAAGILERALDQYPDVVDSLVQGPSTLLHGEFFCTNILVSRTDDEELRIAPFDWETTGLGCGALDLASLLMKQPPGFDESALLSAYAQGWKDDGGSMDELAHLARQVALARMHHHIHRIWSTADHHQASEAKMIRYANRLDEAIQAL